MNILFGKRKSGKETNKPTPTLTPVFAQEVLDLEEQLNINCTLPIVTRLMELYKKAIEFYEAEKNLKHIHYQERMQNLLSRNNVISLFKSTHNAGKQNNAITETLKIPEIKTPERRSPSSKLKLLINTDLNVERTCEKVIKQHTASNSNLSQRIYDNLKNQSEGLNQRLFERRQATTPRLPHRVKNEEMNQCDISAGEAKVNPVEEFEKEVEKILEKNLEERIKIKQQIKDKYQEYFSETEAFKGEIRDKLLNELTKNMNKEIADFIAESDKQRNEEISAARQKLNQKSFRF